MIAARAFLRSPLIHFAAIGGLIFLVYARLDDTPAETPADTIVLTPQAASRLAERFAATWNRPPSPEELDGLMRSWAIEEASVREAVALGLDRGDVIIRQRLALKMRFLAESGAASLVADDATLQSYFEAHPDRFRRPPSFAFEHVLLPARDHDGSGEDLLLALEDGASPASLGTAGLLPASFPVTPAPAIDSMFGTAFHAALAEAPMNEWFGPVESGFGLHLVRVTDRSDASLPPLAEIRDRVEAEWRAAQVEKMRASFEQALLGRYEITLPVATEVLQR